MASKTALNNENLKALGEDRLTDLLMEVANGDAAIKRRLRLELAASESPRKLAGDIRKRISALHVGKTFIGWRGLKGLVSELNALRRLIGNPLSGAEPEQALELMWAYLALADSILERTSDTSGVLLDVFHAARQDIADLVKAAKPDAAALVDDVLKAVLANGYGQADGLVEDLRPSLGDDGLHRLQAALADPHRKPQTPAPVRIRRVSKWRRGQRLERDLVPRRGEADIVHRARLEVADALRDVDAYIRLQSKRRDPVISAGIGRRLFAAGRYTEALTEIDNAPVVARPLPELFSLRAQILEVLDRGADAQQARMTGFQRTLDPDLLRQYLKRLPDFDDIEAEEAALDFARKCSDVDAALEFLLRWPSLDRASDLVIERSSQIGSGNEDLLLLGAAKLGPRYPLPAMLLLRKLVATILMESRDRDYTRAADYLSEAEQLAAHIDDIHGFESHKTWLGKLHANFRHRQEFWDIAA